MKVRPIKFNPKKFLRPGANYSRCKHIPDFKTLKTRDLRYFKWFERIDGVDDPMVPLFFALCGPCAKENIIAKINRAEPVQGYDANGSPVTE